MKALLLNFCKKSNARLTENEKLPQTRTLPKIKFFGWPKDGFERCTEKPKRNTNQKQNLTGVLFTGSNKTDRWQRIGKNTIGLSMVRIPQGSLKMQRKKKEPYARWRSLFAPVFCLHLNRRGEDDRSSLGRQGCRQKLVYRLFFWYPNFQTRTPFILYRVREDKKDKSDDKALNGLMNIRE